jgi:Na+-driven multidrug efflux pump
VSPVNGVLGKSKAICVFSMTHCLSLFNFAITFNTIEAIWSVFEYAPSGFGTAAEIRIAFHLGNGNPVMAKVAAYKNLFYATIWATLVTVVFFFSADKIINYFTADATLIVMLQELVTLISAGNVLMAVGSVAYSILTAQSRVKLATKITFFCSWCINIPLASYWVFRRNYGLDSIVAALLIGYATVEIALLYGEKYSLNSFVLLLLFSFCF